MLYSEFVEGTGCRENDHNFKVYKDLEIMYMNSNMSKQEIYEYGKKLVDNSDTPEQVALKAEIRAQIDSMKKDIAHYKSEIEFYKDMEWGKNTVKYAKEMIKSLRQQIRASK